MPHLFPSVAAGALTKWNRAVDCGEQSEPSETALAVIGSATDAVVFNACLLKALYGHLYGLHLLRCYFQLPGDSQIQQLCF